MRLSRYVPAGFGDGHKRQGEEEGEETTGKAE